MFWIVSLIVLAVVLVLVFVPLIGIWALNTLFSLGIAYTFKTWLAMLILDVFIGSGIVYAIND